LAHNRRVLEAAALRVFFHEQWDILHALSDRWADQRRARLSQQIEMDQVVENIVEGTDKRIRGVMRYRGKLREASGLCLQHVQSTVDSLQPPIDVSDASFQEPSQARMLLSSGLKLDELLHEDPDVYDALRRLKADSEGRIYLLFISGYGEKRVFRPELKNGLLLRDVLKTIANFPGRRLILPNNSEVSLRKALKVYLFEQLLVQIRLDIVRLKQQSTHTDLQKDLNNPENYLNLLVELLYTPSKIIQMDQQLLRIDLLGYKVDDAENDTPEFMLQRMSLGEGRSQFMVMLSISQREVLGR